MKASLIPALTMTLFFLSLPGCHQQEDQVHHEPHKVTATSPQAKAVTITQQYVCQIHSHRHIEVCALENGYLEEIPVKEGQTVKQGEELFTILPTLYKAKLDAETAEVQLAQIEYNNTEKLFQQKVVAQPEVLLAQAKLAKAEARMKLAEAELNFATIKAPFDGIIDKQVHQQGSLIAEGDVLTTLSDNSTMWVYFNVPEARYLEYKNDPDRDNLKIELMLADGSRFPHAGKIGAIEADFNNETGNIAFRADFPNPEHLLRHGQTGTVLLSRVIHDALVIPQRATFEILAKKYAYVIEKVDSHEGTKDGGHHESEHVSDRVTADHHQHASRHIALANIVPVAAHVPQDGEEHGSEQNEQHNSQHHGSKGKEHEEGRKVLRGIVRQREIVIQNELDDIYVIQEGLDVNNQMILEGIRQVRDGEEVEYEFVAPEVALGNLKYHAE